MLTLRLTHILPFKITTLLSVIKKFYRSTKKGQISHSENLQNSLQFEKKIISKHKKFNLLFVRQTIFLEFQIQIKKSLL